VAATDPNIDWKVDNNNVLSDVNYPYAYSDFTQPPLQVASQGSLSMGLGYQSSDVLRFRPHDVPDCTGKDTWFDNFKQGQSMSNHGLPYSSYEAANISLSHSQAITPPQWNHDTTHLGTVSPKVLVLRSSTMSLSGSSSSDCDSLSDTVSTYDDLSFESGCDRPQSVQADIKKELPTQVSSVRQKLPSEPPHKLTITSSPDSDEYWKQPVKRRAFLPRQTKVCTQDAFPSSYLQDSRYLPSHHLKAQQLTTFPLPPTRTGANHPANKNTGSP
jgi:hypothetical protein